MSQTRTQRLHKAVLSTGDWGDINQSENSRCSLGRGLTYNKVVGRFHDFVVSEGRREPEILQAERTTT